MLKFVFIVCCVAVLCNSLSIKKRSKQNETIDLMLKTENSQNKSIDTISKNEEIEILPHMNKIYKSQSLQFEKIANRLKRSPQQKNQPAPLYPTPAPGTYKSNFPKLTGGGGNTFDGGVAFGTRIQKDVWQSNNGRHTLGGNVDYGQKIGGTYGSSPPSFGVGAQYTFKF